MIKGLQALFTSGLILNPMVLLGIILGIFSMLKLNAEQMRELFSNPRLYVLVALLSFVYSFVFKKAYQDDGYHLDYTTMSLTFIFGIIRFILACGLTISFIVLMFGF